VEMAFAMSEKPGGPKFFVATFKRRVVSLVSFFRA